MTKRNKIIAGLDEAVAYVRGDRSRGVSHKVCVPNPLDVAAIRGRQGLTQREFAMKYGFSLHTLKNWEQGHRAPTGASRVLLLVIDKNPQAVEAVIRAA